MTSPEMIIGSRGSDLALYQANFIKDILVRDFGCTIKIKIIKTAGDKLDNISFDKMEGKGFFTHELEDALLSREIDLAVHSLKDLMTSQPAGLKLGAVGYRVDRREMLLINKNAKTGEGVLPVKNGGIIGTGSARRKAQIASLSPTLIIKDLRGNVPTRIRKLREGQYDAIIIAAAGIKRLNLDLTDLDNILLDPLVFLPAPAQGVLGIQIRENNEDIEKIISQMNSAESSTEVALERGLLQKYDAGCSLPLGVFSQIKDDMLFLTAVLGIRENDKWIDLRRAEVSGRDISSLVNQVYDLLSR